MDEIKEISNDADKSIYGTRIYSDRLLSLSLLCPDDGTRMKATGDMYLSSITSEWMVEYLCPQDREIFRMWTGETEALTRQIAKDVLGKKDG